MATGVDRLNESAVRAATPQASTARVSVTRPAGPRPSEPWWARPRASAPFTNNPQATPVAHPAPPRPTVDGQQAEQRQHADEPDHRTGLNPTHSASVSRGTRVIRVRRHPGSSGARRRRGEGDCGGRRARVLAARARRRRDPARARAGPGRGRGPGPHAAHRRQPRHRDAGLPRRRPDGPVRRDAGAVPGGRLPGTGQVRLPQRRRRRAGPARAARPHRLLPVPAPDVVRRPGRRGDRRARTTCRPSRAVLAGTVETAVNALWDAAPLVGDRVTVVGAGMVGCCVARLLARMPGRPGHPRRRRRRPGRRRRGARRSTSRRPADAADGRDLVVHTSATSAGLQQSLDLLAPEGTVLDLSWYGDAQVTLSLGGAFHSGRLAHPRQPGRHASPRPGAAGAPPPTGWRSPWTCCATPPSTRCSPASPTSTSCPT